MRMSIHGEAIIGRAGVAAPRAIELVDLGVDLGIDLGPRGEGLDHHDEEPERERRRERERHCKGSIEGDAVTTCGEAANLADGRVEELHLHDGL
jgi:hypothetical protein